MVDIPNHEDPLRELSKTSLINNVTVILCWSAAEAARYLELYKSYEHAGFSAIRGQQAKSYAERLVEFVTVPRGINKADAVALVSAFGTLRNAINADPEQVGLVAGWGEKKVQRWCAVVREPFRVQTAAARTITKTTAEGTKDDQGRGASKLEQAVPLGRVPKRDMPAASSTPSKAAAPSATAQTRQYQIYDPDIDDEDEDEDAMLAAAIEESRRTAQPTGAAGASAPSSSKPAASGSGSAYEMPDGVAAALAKLRQSNG